MNWKRSVRKIRFKSTVRNLLFHTDLCSACKPDAVAFGDIQALPWMSRTQQHDKFLNTCQIAA